MLPLIRHYIATLDPGQAGQGTLACCDWRGPVPELPAGIPFVGAGHDANVYEED